MCHIVSTSSVSYDKPSTVKLAGNVFDNINQVVSNEIVDNDGKLKRVNYLNSNNSLYSVYMENDKMTRCVEDYKKPQTRLLGGKLYNNIVTKLTIPGKYDTYIVMKPSGKINQIQVGENNLIIDANELKQKMFQKKCLAPIKNIIKKLACILL